ncbi:E3 binding domain-containing protein [Pseudoramibacter sp.]|jgi:pyruvate/2-oxoglutarate dehydrogenase complex dihydrolipoamide acyltransferase (E2) component|uniref:E3 binding domain-containing protein n=1 Tax=Pseudoramibacter sp. TaxID=2034862 RepID=UPI0025E3E4E6|nr:E3 binding domain-containing protein [Pseudoramibacter sp.]MCH4071433.1 E3 binding domain-containing protein [Pseudoramibacter sp.]MCH4105201.1 E3 binding domain-containing protein [Pseudoramibacter sp.]
MDDRRPKVTSDRLSLRNLGGHVRQNKQGGQVLPATPAARRYAAEKGVDLQELSEIGRERRITEHDIDVFLEKKKIFEKRAQNGRRQEVQETLDQPEEPTIKPEKDDKTEASEDVAEQAAEPETAEETAPQSEDKDKAKEKETGPDEAQNPKAQQSSASPKTSPKVSEVFHLEDLDSDAEHFLSVTPLARALAEEHHVDLKELAPGSGPNGRIVRYDVRQWLKAHGEDGADQKAKGPSRAKAVSPEKPADAPKPEAAQSEPEKTEVKAAPEPVQTTQSPKGADAVTHDPVAARIFRTIQKNMTAAPKSSEPERPKREVIEASAKAEQAMPEGDKPDPYAKAGQEDPDDALALGPFSLVVMVDVTRIHDYCWAQVETASGDDVDLVDHIVAAAARSLSLHPKVSAGGTEIALMTLSERKGLICTPGFEMSDRPTPKEVAVKRRALIQAVEEDQAAVPGEGIGLHVMALGQGIGLNYICDKQRAPILAVGGVRREMQMGGIHYTVPLTLSQKRGTSNVAASVAFLNTLKTFLENPDTLFQMEAGGGK